MESTKEITKSEDSLKQDEFHRMEIIHKEEMTLSEIRSNLIDEFCSKSKIELNSNAQIVKERLKSISMISKIANSMVLKKPNLSLAIAYLDKYIDAKTDTESIRAAAIASLVVSLKVEHA